ncbi:unnamed protein product [Nezara viridula]|uniref:Uncharacterized protein n=1 Tax=Nezara viridula TaxID=85310 RepID=A0A9P0MSJ3_NEZVI|nr:unnamed protein product [Nezara viridula]
MQKITWFHVDRSNQQRFNFCKAVCKKQEENTPRQAEMKTTVLNKQTSYKRCQTKAPDLFTPSMFAQTKNPHFFKNLRVVFGQVLPHPSGGGPPGLSK